MRTLILGGDGYLGWPTAMHLAERGHEVTVVDNYLKRQLTEDTGGGSLIPTPKLGVRSTLFHEATGKTIYVREGDCSDLEFLRRVVRETGPDAVVHYAEQPSGAYSMIGANEARLTLDNNLGSTLALAWAVMEEAPKHCHIVKLGTMGEYGTPNVDIPEGFFDLRHNGRLEVYTTPPRSSTPTCSGSTAGCVGSG